MKILIINGSHRKNGNCFKFAEVAKNIFDTEHEVSIISLIDKSFTDCNGCLVCEEGEKCPLIDDFSEEICLELESADLIIFATPSYFNMPSAQMVKFIDRTNCLCDYFMENQKKCLFYLTGQTDEDSILIAYDCLKAYVEIMGMVEIAEPIVNVVRMPEEVSNEIINKLIEISKLLND